MRGAQRRRGLMALALTGAVALTACGSAGDRPATGTAPPDGDAAGIIIRGATGAVAITPTDTGIWALDDATAVHLLSIGVTPAHAARNAYSGDEIVAAGYRLAEDAGVQLAEPGNAELVAAAAPSLIVGMDFPDHHEILPELQHVAPVLLTDDLAGWDEQLELLGAATGHETEAAALVGRLRASIDELARRIAAADHAGASVSLLSDCGAQVCAYGAARTAGSLLEELGFTRPEAQRDQGNDWGYINVSREQLDEHEADIVLSLTGSVSARPVFEDAPLLDTSDAVTAAVDFGAWFSVGALNVQWMLHDVDALLFGDGEPATAADAGELWDRLTGG